MDEDRKEIEASFRAVVNMTPAALETWLGSEESRSVGWVDGNNKRSSDGPESVGHQSGRRIIEIRHKKSAELTEDDHAHMKKVVGYVRRHLAQKPAGDVEHSRWRASLMNWGHDPMKD